MDNRLKQFRIHMNLTQQQMAELLGVAQNSYSRMENGVTAFKDAYKKTIEERFHLTVGWLSGADVPMFASDPVAGVMKSSTPRINKEKLKEQILDELVEKRIHEEDNSIYISKEVFEQITRLTETVLSQQRTIEYLQDQNKKILAQQGSTAKCAHVGGSDISI